MIKYLLLILFYLLMLQGALAQKTEPATAPGAMPLFFEKPYLHTDHETYVAGDDIWFKAYLVGARTNKPIESSRNLYVELISPYSEILSRITVRLDKGTGAGDFRLNDTIPFGTYRIRAYTNWMRNFGDNFVFEKEITVHSLHQTAAEVVAVETTSPAKASLEHAVTNPHVRLAPEAQIQFFPEGGALVNGVTSVVAFKADDARGDGVKVSGSVYTSSGDTLCHINSANSGMGSFLLTPEPGVTYHVKGKLNDVHPFKVVLPAVLSKGFVLHVTHADSATLRVVVTASSLSLQEQHGKAFLLVARQGSRRKFELPVLLQGSETHLSLAKNQLPPGLVIFTLYDGEQRPHCERVIFVPQSENTRISITPDKTEYAAKSKVTLTVSAVGKDNLPAKANLSLVAVDAGVVPPNSTDIQAYLLLQSEIKGKIAQPSQYFDPNNKNRYQHLDLLLLTQGWRDFTWKKLADSAYAIKYLPEQGFTVSGRLKQTLAKKPVSGANITLSAFKAKGQKLFGTKTDASGMFYFDGVQLFGRQHITVSALSNRGNKTGYLFMDSLLMEPLPVKPVPLFRMPYNQEYENAPEEMIQRRATMRRYSLSDTILLGEFELQTIKQKAIRSTSGGIRSGRKDREYIITEKDYGYKTLGQFIAHHIPEDHRQDRTVRFVGNDEEISEEDLRGERYYNALSFRKEAYYGLSIQKVKKLVLRQYVSFSGNTMYVLYITTTPGAIDQNDLNKASARVEGYYQNRLFYSPQYDTRDNPGQIDLRTTIYWQHTILTDESGEATITYFNADPATKIRIVAEGITEDGIPVVGTAEYDVK